MKETKIQGVLIDPFKRMIYEITVQRDSINDIYRAIDAEIFECVELDNGDAIYVDEEGSFNGRAELNGVKHGFQIAGVTLWGKGLILGTDFNSGSSKDCTSTVSFIFDQIVFGTAL